MGCHGSSEGCGTQDHELPDDGMVCGFCHPELIGDHDRQVIRDFSRFLSEAAPAFEAHMARALRWQWLAYALGRMDAPPLMWEGDDS